MNRYVTQPHQHHHPPKPPPISVLISTTTTKVSKALPTEEENYSQLTLHLINNCNSIKANVFTKHLPMTPIQRLRLNET